MISQPNVEAALELHHSVGPAHTTDLAIAAGARVTPRTLYRHFPTEVDLFRACMARGQERWPPPDPEPWRAIQNPEARLRRGLTELYRYFRDAGHGLVVIVRDQALLAPEVRRLSGRGDVLRAIPTVLLEGWDVDGRARAVLAAAIALATSVDTWHSLVEQHRLNDEEAVELLLGVVSAAEGRGSRHPPRGRSGKF